MCIFNFRERPHNYTEKFIQLSLHNFYTKKKKKKIRAIDFFASWFHEIFFKRELQLQKFREIKVSVANHKVL